MRRLQAKRFQAAFPRQRGERRWQQAGGADSSGGRRKRRPRRSRLWANGGSPALAGWGDNGCFTAGPAAGPRLQCLATIGRPQMRPKMPFRLCVPTQQGLQASPKPAVGRPYSSPARKGAPVRPGWHPGMAGA
ncbi:uncharacterized protein LOC128574957 isoform X2 [Nycticebus coucang]|uniref:uncharacterized protein LOC128574957 isoform X2 n=1 Tax=Nycticebus coucang TaxID=9470 RepID=UPI00234DE663|nr:uncharacterized protein LOC128574957 isoform X2 [Nycticebus coucang]